LGVVLGDFDGSVMAEVTAGVSGLDLPRFRGEVTTWE
jgi:hypothetical protein